MQALSLICIKTVLRPFQKFQSEQNDTVWLLDDMHELQTRMSFRSYLKNISNSQRGIFKEKIGQHGAFSAMERGAHREQKLIPLNSITFTKLFHSCAVTPFTHSLLILKRGYNIPSLCRSSAIASIPGSLFKWLTYIFVVLGGGFVWCTDFKVILSFW